MSQKNYVEDLGAIALWRDMEVPKGSAATSSGVSMRFDKGSGVKLARPVEDDSDTIRGAELPTETFCAARSAAGSYSQKRCKPDFLAFVLAYFLGDCVSTAAGPTGYEHTIIGLDDSDHPSFTVAQRKGNSIFKERIAGNCINSFELSLGESFCVLKADIASLGKREVNYTRETVTTAANATTIQSAANGVQGSSAGVRISNVFQIKGKDTGSDDWTYPVKEGLSPLSVSTGVPADIVMPSAVGTGTGNIDLMVDYIPVEPGWCSFPGENPESPLKMMEAQITLDGYFNGTAISGGRVIPAGSVFGCTIKGENSINVEHGPGLTSDLSGCDSTRGGRRLTITIPRKLRDTILEYQADHADSEDMAVRFLVQGAEIDVGLGFFFGAELIFPKCRLQTKENDANKDMLQETAVIEVLDDGTYGGVVIKAYNKVASYV
jgi:hypothetical protein